MSTGHSHRDNGQSPRVSIVIPAYRVTDFIVDTLESVFNQTYTNYEVIVVNDGSPDTDRLEQTLAPYRDRIRFIVQQNGGPSSARNTAIRAARGSLVAQLDGDDQWYPTFLESQVRFLDDHPDVDLVFSNAVIFGGPNDGRAFFTVNHTAGPVSLASLLSQRVVLLASSMTGRREVLERVGLYDERLRGAEDYDLWLRLAAAGARMAYQRDILVRYRRGPHSVSSDEPSMIRYGLTVLDKVARTFQLTPEDRASVEEGRIRMQSTLSYRNGVTALRRGDAEVASREFAEVKRSTAPVRLWVLRTALRMAPRLTTGAYRRIKGTN
jgi:glycosyltransferase involved in cell wall biosynthesis